MDEIVSLLSTWGAAIAVIPLALVLSLGMRGKMPKAIAPVIAAAAITGAMAVMSAPEPLALAAPLIVGALMVLGMRGQDQMWPVLLSLALAGPAAWLLMYGEVPAQAVTPPARPASAPKPPVAAASAAARTASADADMAGGGRPGLALDAALGRKGDRGEAGSGPAPADTASQAAPAGGSLSKATGPMNRPAPVPVATPAAPTQPALPPMSNAPVTIPVVPGEAATPTYVPPVASGQVQNSTSGQHPGFAAECRWVSPTVWACPQGSSR